MTRCVKGDIAKAPYKTLFEHSNHIVPEVRDLSVAAATVDKIYKSAISTTAVQVHSQAIPMKQRSSV